MKACPNTPFINGLESIYKSENPNRIMYWTDCENFLDEIKKDFYLRAVENDKAKPSFGKDALKFWCEFLKNKADIPEPNNLKKLVTAPESQKANESQEANESQKANESEQSKKDRIVELLITFLDQYACSEAKAFSIAELKAHYKNEMVKIPDFKEKEYEDFSRIKKIFACRSQNGEEGIFNIIEKSISFILSKYIFKNKTKPQLSYEEILVTYVLYEHCREIWIPSNTTNMNIGNGKDKYEVFEQILDTYTAYCNTAISNFKSKGMSFLSGTNQHDSSNIRLLRPIISLFAVYYLVSGKDKLNKFCQGAKISCKHVSDAFGLLPTSPSLEELYIKIYKSTDALNYDLALFSDLEEDVKTHSQKGITQKIKKELKAKDCNYDDLKYCMSKIIQASEGVNVPILDTVLEEVKKRFKEADEETDKYILEVAESIEKKILTACENNLFCKTFKEKGNISAIRKYVLLNTRLDGKKYVIQDDLVAVYNHIIDILDKRVTDEDFLKNWNYDEGHPPSSKDLVNTLSLLSHYLLMRAIKGKKEGKSEVSARLWKWEDIQAEEHGDDVKNPKDNTDKCKPIDVEKLKKDIDKYKTIFENEGIICRSKNDPDTYEFENQCYRLILAALGYMSQCENSTEEHLKHIDAFLEYYSEQATSGASTHLEYHMDDACIYICMMLLAMQSRDELILEMCKKSVGSSSPNGRVKQEAYIFCLSLLLVQSRFRPTSEIRKKIFSLFETNAYHYQIVIYNNLRKKDPFFSQYAEHTFELSIDCKEENNYKVPAPRYIYMIASSSDKLIGESFNDDNGVRTYSLDTEEIRGIFDKNDTEKSVSLLFDSFKRMQYLTWSKSEAYGASDSVKIKFRQTDLSVLVQQAEKVFDENIRLDVDVNSDILKLTYGFQLFLMAMSNIERSQPGTFAGWTGYERYRFIKCMLYSEYYNRKYSLFYNEKDMNDDLFWLQCGGLRFVASLHKEKSDLKIEKIHLNEKIYEAFNNALKTEKKVSENANRKNNWRFFYMLLRLVGYSDFFDYLKKSGSSWEIPKKLPESMTAKDLFLTYDYMDDWMENIDGWLKEIGYND